MSDKQTLDVLAMPYSQRQLVIVQPDEVVIAARQAIEQQKLEEGTTDWTTVVGRIAKAVILTPILPSKIMFEVGIEALNAWAKARESGLSILQIGRSEAQALQFPPGHPIEQTLYVAHPALPSVYYTAANFHRMAFEHKFAEAILLLMNLGASKITVEHVTGWSREFSAKMSAALPEANIDATVGQSTESKRSLLFEAVLNNKRAPSIPTDLVWYPHEPTWQAVANGRMSFGLTQFSLAVNYVDDFGVNAGLKLRAQRAGFDLGGTFENHTATTWKIYGDFATN